MDTTRARLTAGRIAALECPPDKSQTFAWDTEAPALAVRVTPSGRKAYVFERRLHGKTIRTTIGGVADWALPAARTEARRLSLLVDAGIDPREVARQEREQHERATAKEKAEAVTVGEAWDVYVAERRARWSRGHIGVHDKFRRAAGDVLPSGRVASVDGPLRTLMGLPLRALTADVVAEWARIEGARRPTSANLARSLLLAFCNWAADHPDYRDLLPPRNPAKGRRIRDHLPEPKARTDCLTREQLPAWFAAVRAIDDPVPAALLQVLLLVGARRNEIENLQWDDVNAKWRAITIHDKVEGERTIPLTPYVASLLAALPRRGPYVFTSARTDRPFTAAHRVHHRALEVAGIPPMTVHALRRSFGTLSEWLDLPAGVIAQIQGHAPSATAERHYRARPLDMLRMHHARFEAWMLEQAGVPVPNESTPQIRAVP